MPTESTTTTRRARIERTLNQLTRAYKIRKATGRRVEHLLLRCKRLSAAWLETRENELNS